MSSIIKVNTVQDADGNNIINESGDVITVGAAGDTVTVPGNVVKSNALQAADAGNIVSQSGTTITIGASGDTVALASGASQTGFGSNTGTFRNIIINGDMNIAQRATSTASITSDGFYSCDRWKLGIGSFGTWTQSQVDDGPAGYGFGKALKMDCTTAQTSPAGSGSILLEYSIEGQHLQEINQGTAAAKQTTLSFWHKHTKTGTNTVELLDADNSNAVSGSYTQSVSNTWEKATITFPANTSGAYDNDNARSLRIRFAIGKGTDLTSGTLATTWQTSITNANRHAGQVNNADSTSNNFIITGVQYEVGDTATDFEYIPIDVNLKRCERYYEIIVDNKDGIGLQVVGLACHTYKVDQINMPVIFKTEKRANSPSLEFVSGAYYEMRTHGSTVTTSSLGVTGAQTGKQNAVPYFNTSGQTEHEGWTFYVQNTAAHMAFSSEL